eukprot:TRINITY_DN214_c1_g1_i4.p1 TRINITY_DN214_c1_g1~~TRINITY_DN214_c1_g1_i4.p1  ORF type:complete len:215 (-),score=98.77 TRINITY_DN214_c1_g1_i4:117-761(-)
MHLLLGRCYDCLNDVDKAYAEWRKIKSQARKGYALDEYSKRQAKNLLEQRGQTEFDKTFMQGFALYETKRFNESFEKLNEAETLIQTDNDRPLLFYLRGACFQKLKQFDQAKAAFSQVLLCEKKITKVALFIIPFAYCCLGEIEMENATKLTDRQAQQKGYEDANKLFKKALNYKNYDFESWVSARIKRAQERAAATTSTSTSTTSTTSTTARK